MNTYRISINQLVNFTSASQAGKRAIIKQQLRPSPVKVSRYRLSKTRIARSIIDHGSLGPIREAIKMLKAKEAKTSWQINDKKVSLEALERFSKMKLPRILEDLKYVPIKKTNRIFEVRTVDIVVAPEIIIKGTINGKSVIGGVKIHISKNGMYDLESSQYVASIVYNYLNKESGDGETAIPELCFCLDVFRGTFVQAPARSGELMSKVEKFCDELKSLWKQAN
ncbi:MAG: hypothetical protein AB7K37_11565 [Cyclobacteriaceae bacterium]